MTKEDLKNYIRIKNELKYLCSKWASSNLEEWQHYQGYDIKDEFIVINYTYIDYWSNVDNTYSEWDSIKVSIDDIINQ
jgi:hypothetical protein